MSIVKTVKNLYKVVLSGWKTSHLIVLMIFGACLNSFSQAVPQAFQWPKGKKMALSLTFDDARLSQVDNGVPLLDKYGVKATFYVLPSDVKARLQAWKAASANGHEIGNHSLHHPCTGNFDWSRDHALENYSLPQMQEELDSAGKAIEQLMGVKPVSFAYPCGQKFVGKGSSTKSYVPVVSTLFETGRSWYDEAVNAPGFCDLSQLAGIELDGKSFDQIKAVIEEAKKQGQWLVLVGHEIADKKGELTSLIPTIELICRMATDTASGIWIDNVHNIASYIKKQRGESAFISVPVYKNPLLPIRQRVEDLLSRMTLEEKIGQLNMPGAFVSDIGKNIPEKVIGCQKLTEGTLLKNIGPIGGFFTIGDAVLQNGSLEQAQYFNKLQRIAIEKTRLGIPLLQTEEGTHGLMCSGATIFPEGHALGSSWNMGLVNDVYSVAAREARSVGIHQLFTLVIEPTRDPRLGRNQEGFSEDPYFCSRIAETIVHAIQGNDVSAKDKTIAGLCHFPGQSEPVSGMENGAMDISERKLREVFLPPWVAGIKKSGALGVMATYPSIDGIPTHASEFLLTDILRNELSFNGLVLSEGYGIATIVKEHVAKDQKEAGAITIKAGLDVAVTFEKAFLEPMIENVNEGKVSMELIDRAVRRVLTLKMKLGLFENPYVDPAYAVKTIHSVESQELALNAARESIIMLKNEKNILPLRKDNIKKIAVIGPNANDSRNQLGDYTSIVVLQDITTVLDGIKATVLPDTKVEYVKGCEVVGDSLNEISKAVKAASNADVAIVVLGENEWLKPRNKGTVGEGFDQASLNLTGLQEDLLKAVYKTGTPVVLVLINGRPLSIPWAAEHVSAIVEAWNPGEKGGQAVADILFGKYNPSGKLPVTVARHAGQLPVYYNFMPSKQARQTASFGASYVDMPFTPLWEFGFGLSYTKFEYSNLRITPGEIGSYGDVTIKADIRNVGDIKGSETAQLYIRDVIASVVRPVKELKGFEKVELEPGETKTVEFKLTHEKLGFYDKDMDFVVEPGTFEIMVGASSEDIRLKGEFLVSNFDNR